MTMDDKVREVVAQAIYDIIGEPEILNLDHFDGFAAVLVDRLTAAGYAIVPVDDESIAKMRKRLLSYCGDYWEHNTDLMEEEWESGIRAMLAAAQETRDAD